MVTEIPVLSQPCESPLFMSKTNGWHCVKVESLKWHKINSVFLYKRKMNLLESSAGGLLQTWAQSFPMWDFVHFNPSLLSILVECEWHKTRFPTSAVSPHNPGIRQEHERHPVLPSLFRECSEFIIPESLWSFRNKPFRKLFLQGPAGHAAHVLSTYFTQLLLGPL